MLNPNMLFASQSTHLGYKAVKENEWKQTE